MLALPLVAIAAALAFFAAVPVVLFALMLETCREQAPKKVDAANEELEHSSVRTVVRKAA